MAVTKDGTDPKVVVDWTGPTNPGTIDGTNLATITGYTVKCSGVSSFTVDVAADAVTYTHGTEYTSPGDATCTVTAKNSASLSTISASDTATLAL